MARQYRADAPRGSISAHGGYCDDASASSAQRFEDDDDEEEMSALEYARFCGFCKDFLLENPFRACTTTLLTLDDEPLLDDLHRALGVKNVSVDELGCERITCDKDGVVLLQRVVISDDKHNPLDSLPEPVLKPSMKMELPLLQTDHGMDMRSFTRSTDVKLCDLRLPLEHVNIEEDEGFEWPQKFLKLPETTFDEISNARLECPREAMAYLQGLLIESATSNGLDDLYDEVKPYIKPAKARLMTPPLLPTLSPPLQPFDPSSETGQLPFLSDSRGSVTAEVETLDRQLQGQDRIHALDIEIAGNRGAVETDEIMQIYTPLQSDLRLESESALSHKRKREELTVEVPMVASDSSSSDTSKRIKTVSFAEELRTFIPDLPSPCAFENLRPESEASMEAFFTEVLNPVAEAAIQATEREQLQAADSMQRVEVPTMDFNLPLPPWKESNGCFAMPAKSMQSAHNEWANIVSEIKEGVTTPSGYGTWKLNGMLERKLQPYPFRAELGRVPKEQGIDDSRYIAIIMSDMSLENVVTSDALVWKPDGLRVLRRLEFDYEDDELEAVDVTEEFYEEGDIDALVRKRRRELELTQEAGKSSQPAAVSHAQNASGTLKAPTARMIPPEQMKSATATAQVSDQFFADQFSTAGGLQRFMHSMGQQGKSSGPEDRVNQHAPELAKAVSVAYICKDTVQTQVADAKDVGEQNIVARRFDLPPLHSRLPQRSVILSITTAQAHRQLRRIVFKELYPNANYVERDFKLLPGAPEADILISPGTGLILTSLQKIKQKSLPGQEKQLTGVRDCIQSLEARYQTLIVLVSDAMMPDTEVIDWHDGEAMASFAAFCSTCKCEVQIRYVPAGDSNLAAWIAASICDYGNTGQDMSLLQEETLWEQVLRRAGLNAYAAQSVLASLKAGALSSSSDPSPGTLTSSTKEDDFGIRAFIRMTHEERIVRFEGLLGGRRVLQRVSKALDCQWLSAMTGFR